MGRELEDLLHRLADAGEPVLDDLEVLLGPLLGQLPAPETAGGVDHAPPFRPCCVEVVGLTPFSCLTLESLLPMSRVKN